MKNKLQPAVDYRRFRFSLLNTDEFRHLKLLLFWPLFGLLFLYVERFYPVSSYHVVHCVLDDYIPFCEFFIIPYLFWFVYLIGMLVYTLFFDVETFRRLMKFIIITGAVAILIYLVFPTCQELRPLSFARDNIITRFMAGFYQFDTNTNVCPSLHVTYSLAVMFSAWNSQKLQSPGWKWAFGISALLICVSTLFVKQHSVIDVLAALPLCLLAYVICFFGRKEGVKVK